MILFLKAHVAGYTKKDGTLVRPHEDRRPLPDHLKGKLWHVRNPGLASQQSVAKVRSADHAMRLHQDGKAVLVHADTADAAEETAFAWGNGKPVKEDHHQDGKASFPYIRAT